MGPIPECLTAHLHNKKVTNHTFTRVKRTASALHVVEFTF